MYIILGGDIEESFLSYGHNNRKSKDLQFVYIILGGDIEESFLSYGHNNRKSKVLYLAAKDRIPNAIISTCFKKHFHEIMNERLHNEESSDLFFTYHQLVTKKTPSIYIAIMKILIQLTVVWNY